MSLPASSPIVFCFGPFEFYPQTGELRKAGTLLKLRPQPARLLALLLSHPGELVRREQIQQAVWGEEIVVDYDLGVNRCIRQIRAVLLDNPDAPRYLKTVPRQGYMFIAAVEHRAVPHSSHGLAPPATEKAEEAGRPAPESLQTAPIMASTPLPLVPRQQRPRWVGGLVTLSVLLLVLGGYYLFRQPVFPALQVERLTGNAGVEISPALSPSGRQIAYAWKPEGGEFNIYIKQVGQGEPIRLTSHNGHQVSPSWSPDGERLAFLRAAPGHTEIVVIPALGGAEQILFQFRGGFDEWQPQGPKNGGKSGPVWTKDGKAVIVCDTWTHVNGGLIRVDLSGGPTLLTDPGKGKLDFSPAVSPDGESIAFVRGVPGAGDLYTVPVRGGSPRRVTQDGVDIQGVSWWDAETLLFGSLRGGTRGLWRVNMAGRPPLLMSLSAGPDGQDPSVADHLLAYVNSVEQQSIWRRALPSSAALGRSERFIASAGQDHSPRYSPDGQHIAFVSDRSGSWQIWLCASDASHPTRLTRFPGVPVGSPAWSPEGRFLAFDAKVGPYSQIWLLDVLAGTAPRPLMPASSEDIIPTWSRDGKWIYFVSDRTGPNQLWKQKVEGGRAVLISHDVALDATESPDGKYLYYENVLGGIWRMPAAGGPATPIPPLLHARMARNWALTPTGIYFADQAQQPPTLSFWPWNASQITQLGRLEGTTINGTPSLTVSPDQHWLLYAQQETRRSTIMIARPGPVP